ncbi:MAG: flagellar export protein FliJ [candidate division Zixibacteria bacterium]|nr:flagellar export protein FliJ [candidate division Zixibacteria bacterium]
MIRRFEFPFEKLLSIREFRKKQAQRELATSLNELREKQQRLERLSRKREELIAGLKSRMNIGRIATENLAEMNRYLDTIKLDMIQCNKEIDQQEGEVETKRTELVRAKQEEEKLKKYKANLYGEFSKKQKRSAMKQIDDIASRQYNSIKE